MAWKVRFIIYQVIITLACIEKSVAVISTKIGMHSIQTIQKRILEEKILNVV